MISDQSLLLSTTVLNDIAVPYGGKLWRWENLANGYGFAKLLFAKFFLSYRALDTTTPPNENKAAGRYSSRYVANNPKVTINFFFECHSLWIVGVPNLSLANQFFSNVRITPNGLVFMISLHHGVEAKTAPCHAFTFTLSTCNRSVKYVYR